ncbi:MAG: PIN domain-containing protein [Actinomycetota bacterium]|jgi:predicted nucleic acid-binding protein|nr:PIN domain-containing protein [Rubrobacter sp.]MDQ3237607.1 PIN domain-containing protein [Actinomycetota bacterium]
MAERTEAYVDTSALIAFVDRSDTHHALFRRLFSEPPGLVTTTLVVAEGHAWFLRRYDRTRALRFLAMIEDMTPLRVVQVGMAELDGATRLPQRFSDQDLTLTDAVGLYEMEEERGVRACWSTDRHLGLTGMSLVVDEH